MKAVFQLGIRYLIVAVALFVLLTVYTSAQASVTIKSFSAQTQGNSVQLSWQTANELNNAGFNILRSTSPTGTFSPINGSMIPSSCLGCVIGTGYSYVDTSAAPNQVYYYKLQSVELNGSRELYGPVSTASNSSSSSSASSSAKASSSSSSASSSKAASSSSSVSSSVASSVSSSASSSKTTSPVASVASSNPSTSSSTSSTTKIAYAASASSSSAATSSGVVSSSNASPLVDVPQIVASESSSARSSSRQAVVTDEPDSQPAPSPWRILGAGMFVGSGLLFLGAFGLGAAAFFFFLRAYVR